MRIYSLNIMIFELLRNFLIVYFIFCEVNIGHRPKLMALFHSKFQIALKDCIVCIVSVVQTVAFFIRSVTFKTQLKLISV